jgi:hypothetical protein
MTRELINQVLSANGDTAEVTVNETGEYEFVTIGNFGGGTITPYITPLNHSTAVAEPSAAASSSQANNTILLGQGTKFKATLADATSPSVRVTLTWIR